jgi:hypothetical protein
MRIVWVILGRTTSCRNDEQRVAVVDEGTLPNNQVARAGSSFDQRIS